MEIQPILAALRRHKLVAALLVLQVAITCAIVTNAVFLIVQRVARVTVPSGLAEDEVSLIGIDDLQAGNNPLSLHQSDLAALRRVPGVASAAIVSNVPLSGNTDATGACASLAAVHAAMAAHSPNVQGCAVPDEYAGGPGALRTLGLKLVAGRAFRGDEYVAGTPGDTFVHAPAVIISAALAQRLYPADPAHVVGRSVYAGSSGIVKGEGTRIVGVVAHLQRGALNQKAGNDQSMLFPIEPNDGYVRFALRSQPAERARVIKTALAILKKDRPERQVSASDGQTYHEIRGAYFSRDTTMIRMLLAAALGLLFVTALGIAGLASFWVGQRTHTIGIRRALGATRAQILHYFQTENLLIVTAGVVLGVILAVGLNALLMAHYELPRLPLWYLVVGAIALWILGQLAVLAPALRAANVPPLVATRSV